MPAAPVYGLCDSDSVAETLAVLLERDCDYHRITRATLADEWATLPRPSLLVDARGRRSGRTHALPQRWPGLRVLRLDLLAHFDPVAARRSVVRALRDTTDAERLREAIGSVAGPLSAAVKSRLVATRCLLAIGRDSGQTAVPWLPLVREQCLAISDSVAQSVLARRL